MRAPLAPHRRIAHSLLPVSYQHRDRQAPSWPATGRGWWTALFALGLVAAGSGPVRSDAFRIPYQGAAAAAQGEAFSAQADDASAIYYNPAALTRLDRWQVSLGTNLVGGSIDFTSPSGQHIEGDLGGSVAVPPPSNFYLAANLKDFGLDAIGPLAVGIGVNGSYGLINRYPKDGPFNSVVITAKLPLLTIKPAIAYQPHPAISFGFGVDIYTFAGILGEGQYTLKSFRQGMWTELNGNGTAVGYNGSLLWTPMLGKTGKPLLNVGFVYRSGTGLPLNGDYRLNGLKTADASTAINLPQVVTGALAYWPIRDSEHEWKIEYDMDFVAWSSFRNFDVRFSNAPPWLPPTFVLAQDWDSSYSLSVGSEYRWLSPSFAPDWDVAVRAGFQRSTTPVPDFTFSPVVPDSDWNILAIGVGMTCKGAGKLFGLADCGRDGQGSIGVDLAFQAALFAPRTIVSNQQPEVVGRYETSLFIGSLNFRYAY